MARLASDITKALKDALKAKTKPSDDVAVVQRIEGDTAWVHIPGGVDETPVQMTINCREGETVRVRRAGGSAWIVGNGSAPPTDDVTATRAEAKAVVASEKADTALEDAQRAHDAADSAEADAIRAQNAADSAVSNLQSVVQGATTVEKAVSVMQTALEAVVDYDPYTDTTTEYFWHDANGAHVLGASGAYRNDITSTGMEIVQVSSENTVAEFTATGATIKEAGGTAIAHLGYGPGNDDQGGTSNAPYYTLGQRASGSAIGNYSVAEGKCSTASGSNSHAEGYAEASGNSSHAEGYAPYGNIIASGTGSHAEGMVLTAGNSIIASGGGSHAEGIAYGADLTASGQGSHAQNYNTIAQGQYQTVIGKFNTAQGTPTSLVVTDRAFIIGNGTDENNRSNAFSVDWTGKVRSAGGISAGGFPSGLMTNDVVLDDNLTVSHASYANGSIDVSSSGYSPIGIVGMHVENSPYNGTYNTWVCLHSFYLSGTTAYYIVRNTHASTDAKIKITATILYAKS